MLYVWITECDNGVTVCRYNVEKTLAWLRLKVCITEVICVLGYTLGNDGQIASSFIAITITITLPK